MNGIINVEFNGFRGSFKSTPKRLSGVFNNMISWEGIQQLSNLVVEGILEEVNGQLNAGFIRSVLVSSVKSFDGLQLASQSRGVLSVLLLEAKQTLFRLIVKLLEFRRRIGKSTFKVVPSPLDGMLNLIREVFQSAERNRFFWWVLNVSITDGIVRNNNLRVALGTESSAFEKGLFVPNTLLVDILPGFDIIDSIDDKVKSCPEVIVEKLLVFFSYSQLKLFKMTLRVHSFTYSTCSFGLIFANMLFSEQELSV